MIKLDKNRKLVDNFVIAIFVSFSHRFRFTRRQIKTTSNEKKKYK